MTIPGMPVRAVLPTFVRRLLAVCLASLGIAGIVALALATWIATAGLTLDARWLRPRIAAALGEALGRPVRLEGGVMLELSLHPGLRIDGVQIDAPPGFSREALARIGSLRLAFDAWPLLERRLTVIEAVGSDVTLSLEQRADGAANWARPTAARTRAPDEASAPLPPDAGPARAAAPDAPPPVRRTGLAFDISQCRLERLAIDYRSARGPPHAFALDLLHAQAPAGQPLRASLSGTVERTFPYEITIDGGPLAALLAGDADWPLALHARFLGSSLSLDGTLAGRTTPGPDTPLAQFDVGLGSPDLGEVERLLQVRLPPVGALAIGTRVQVRAGALVLDALVATLGRSMLTGALALDWRGERPRVSGELTLPTLDTEPFLLRNRPAARPADAPPRTIAQWYRDTADAHFALDGLRAVDADLRLAVGQWLNLPGDVRDARLRVALADGRLSAPVHASVAGVALDGEVALDAAATTPALELALGVADSPLGGLAELLFGLHGIDGRVGGFALRATGAGDSIGALVDSLDARLAIARGRLSYGNAAGERPVSFVLDSLALAVPPGKPIALSLAGTLIGQPLSATVTGTSLASMLAGRTRLDVTAHSRGVRAQARGSFVQTPAGPRSDLAFTLEAARAGDVGRWFRLRESVELPLRISGDAHWQPDRWSLNETLVQVGVNTIHASFSQHTPAPRDGARPRAQAPGPRALLVGQVSADVLDLAQIESLLHDTAGRAATSRSTPGAAPAAADLPAERPAAASLSSGSTDGEPEPARALLDIPVLPARIDLSDTDLHVAVRRVAGSELDLRDLSFDARVRDGRMLASPFAARVLGIGFEGAIALDLRGAVPEGELWLGADDADLGALLRRLALAQHVDAQVAKLVVHAHARGSRLVDLLDRSELLAELQDGRILARDRNTGAQASFALTRGSLRADAGAPLALALEGALDGVPLTLALKTGRATELVRTDRPVPFELEGQASGARAKVVGSLARPLGERGLALALSLSGDRLDRLDPLARASLPPWGPYALEGRLQMDAGGYRVSGMRLRIAHSVLHGHGALDTLARPPRLELALTAPTIQLDDFGFGEWSPFERATSAAPAAESPPPRRDLDSLRAQAVQASDQAQRLLGAQVLRRQDASLSVRVDQVLSGAERLGSGRLEASVTAGRVRIDPVELEVPGGRAQLALDYEPAGRGVRLAAKLHADRFDYGILARRVKPGTDLRGRASIDLDLRADAPSLAEAMRYGNGTLDLAVWPENIRADVFDLWAINVFAALVDRLDPASTSRVNCAVGRFTLADGHLTDRLLLIDATRVRVIGEGSADLRDERIDLRMRPHPKAAQFFSLATPIRVSGGLRDFHVGVTPGGVLETIGRLATSLLWVPLQKLFGKEIPADGHDMCGPPGSATLPEAPLPDAARPDAAPPAAEALPAR
jgi:uncharacterized protein involved in outer membrane biogenesis